MGSGVQGIIIGQTIWKNRQFTLDMIVQNSDMNRLLSGKIMGDCKTGTIGYVFGFCDLSARKPLILGIDPIDWHKITSFPCSLYGT